MMIHVEKQVADSILPESRCRCIVSRVLRDEGFTEYDLTLVMTDNRHLRNLNRRFRGIDRPTDVIAFALLEGAQHPVPSSQLGDVYVSVPRAKRQARQYGVAPGEEMARLLIHGVLHLLGYDHIKPAQAKKMRRREERYLGQCCQFFTNCKS